MTTPDLLSRLRRAAEVLDQEATARMAEIDDADLVNRRPAETRIPRRRWMTLAAAACLLVAGTGVLVVAGGRGSTPGDQLPTGPTSEPETTDGFLQPGWNDLPEAPIAARYAHLTVATDTGMFVWGGLDDPDAVFHGDAVSWLHDGAHLDLTTGTWTEAPPFPFDDTSGIATGAWVDGEVIVITQIADPERDQWNEPGGAVAAAYDPAANTWEALPTPPIAGPIYVGPRPLFAVDGMAVYIEPSMDDPWGSADCRRVESEARDDNGPLGTAWECDDDGDSHPVADDVRATVTRFDADTREWSQGSAPPSEMYEGVWGVEVGDQILVAGPTGDDIVDECHAPLYLYNPSSDEWAPFSDGPDEELAIAGLAWTGTALFAATPDVCHPGSWSEDHEYGYEIEPADPFEIDGHDDLGAVDDATDSNESPRDRDGSTTGTLVLGPHGPLDGPAEAPEPSGRLTTLDGEHTSFPAPRYVSSIRGWWTGTSVAMVGDDGLPLFYHPDTAAWHEAPAHDDVNPPGNFGDRGYWRGQDTVWSTGAMVIWGGIDLADLETMTFDEDGNAAPPLTIRQGGIAYVPPPDFG